ncbi:unnamed protein product [Discosporangium mesarthrocarpum]
MVIVRSLGQEKSWCESSLPLPPMPNRAPGDKSKCHHCRSENSFGGPAPRGSPGGGMSRHFQYQRRRLHVPLGEDGGCFVVSDRGTTADCCAWVWHCWFDEGSCQLKVSAPKAIKSAPWPPPESLCLVGTLGPKCELIVFKEEESPTSEHRGNKSWWISLPDSDAWRQFIVPIGQRGDLSLPDFVDLFHEDLKQLLVLAWRLA